jgi:hypothetical protein
MTYLDCKLVSYLINSAPDESVVSIYDVENDKTNKIDKGLHIEWNNPKTKDSVELDIMPESKKYILYCFDASEEFNSRAKKSEYFPVTYEYEFGAEDALTEQIDAMLEHYITGESKFDGIFKGILDNIK